MESNYLLEVSKILLPAIISIIVVFIARHLERKRDAELKIREKKIQIYEDFVNKSMNFVLNHSKANEKQKQKMFNDMTNAFENFSSNLLFWGSDKVIKGYNNYRCNTNSSDGYKSMENFEKFIFILRKDIGHDNKKLVKWDLIKLLLLAEEIDEKGNIKITSNDKK